MERNIAWSHESLDHDLLREVRRILRPVTDKQWGFDSGANQTKETSTNSKQS